MPCEWEGYVPPKLLYDYVKYMTCKDCTMLHLKDLAGNSGDMLF